MISQTHCASQMCHSLLPSHHATSDALLLPLWILSCSRSDFGLSLQCCRLLSIPTRLSSKHMLMFRWCSSSDVCSTLSLLLEFNSMSGSSNVTWMMPVNILICKDWKQPASATRYRPQGCRKILRLYASFGRRRSVVSALHGFDLAVAADSFEASIDRAWEAASAGPLQSLGFACTSAVHRKQSHFWPREACTRYAPILWERPKKPMP